MPLSPVITIRTYANIAEAGYAHSLLESQGIQAFLLGEHSYTMETIPALQGIRLQVPEPQIEEALSILAGEGFAPLPDDFVPPDAGEFGEKERPTT